MATPTLRSNGASMSHLTVCTCSSGPRVDAQPDQRRLRTARPRPARRSRSSAADRRRLGLLERHAVQTEGAFEVGRGEDQVPLVTGCRSRSISIGGERQPPTTSVSCSTSLGRAQVERVEVEHPVLVAIGREVQARVAVGARARAGCRSNWSEGQLGSASTASVQIERRRSSSALPIRRLYNIVSCRPERTTGSNRRSRRRVKLRTCLGFARSTSKMSTTPLRLPSKAIFVPSGEKSRAGALDDVLEHDLVDPSCR